MNCGFQWELGEGFGTIWGTVGHGAGRDIRLWLVTTVLRQCMDVGDRIARDPEA